MRWYLLVAVLLWPMCCHTGMPCHRHRTWHPTSSQYTNTGPTCHAIHWCGPSYRYTQLPTLMSWVWPDQEILLRPSTHISEYSTDHVAGMVVISQKLSRKCTITHQVMNPGPVVCESITLSARPPLPPAPPPPQVYVSQKEAVSISKLIKFVHTLV